MQTETAFDLRYNVAAMYIAILREDIATPEQAFAVLEGRGIRKVYSNEDIADMAKLNERGFSYSKIGEMYGISRDAVYHRVKRYKDGKEKETSQTAI